MLFNGICREYIDISETRLFSFDIPDVFCQVQNTAFDNSDRTTRNMI